MKNRRGTTTEYILILTLILGVGLIILWNTLGPAIAEKIRSMGLDYQWLSKKSASAKEGSQAGETGAAGGLLSGSGGSTDSGETSYGSTAIDSTGPVTSH